MREKLFSMLMVFVVLSLVLSAVSVVAPSSEPASAQTGGLNSWVRHDLPTTLHWQMAPNTDIWDLTSADDGTLFALVEDTSGADDIISGGVPLWDGLRWAVFPAWSDVALFKSTDGGYTWTLVWHVPASDSGAPVAVVPQPGYVDGDAANDAVFVATGTRRLPTVGASGTWVGGQRLGDVYRSLDGGSTFTRVTPRCPAVDVLWPAVNPGGTLYCMDVAESRHVPGEFVVVVGVVGSGDPGAIFTNGNGEGVYTWNEDGDRDWKDLQIANALPPAPFPGTLPAGNGLHVVQVKFSPNYTEDGQIVAVANDGLGFAGAPMGIYVCFYDELDGTWGGDVNSPTNVRVGSTNSRARVVSIAMGDDHTKVDNCYVFVVIGNSGSPGPLNIYDDVWRIQGLATVSGPSTATAMGLGPAGGGPAVNLNDIIVQGPAASGAVYVGCEFPGSTGPGTGQAQVYKGIQATLWPAWTPAFKPPSGAWPTFITDMSGTLMAAGGGDGFTYGGVHRCAAGCTTDCPSGRMVFNGVGLLDDIAVSEDIPGYVNNNQPLVSGTSWCLAEAGAEEVSPTYETDKLMYVSTFSYWDADGPTGPQPMAYLSLWRWTDGIHWERIMKEYVTLPTSLSAGPNNDQFRGMTAITNLGLSNFASTWTWWPRVSRIFSEDPYVFLLGGRGDSGSPAYQQMLWYSPDKGDTWIAATQMPFMAGGVGLTEMGWWVHDNNTVFLSDYNGWIYRTTDRGASWTEGARTSPGQDIDCIITSPNYDNDHIVIVGALSWGQDRQNEVWISQDGAVQDFENIGAEINTNPTWLLGLVPSATMVTFDKDWGNNHMIYATACGPLDRWELVGTGSKELTRIDYTDVGVYRTVVNLNEPSASTWEQVWDADDFNAAAPPPQPLPNMLPGQDIFRRVIVSDVQVGSEGSLYVPFTVLDYSYNMFMVKPPSPRAGGRFTAGGVLRCLEPTQAVTEWNVIDQGLGEWDGLWLNRAAAGDSNTLVSLAWDWQEWRWKLAIYDDTLCTQSDPAEPMGGDTAVGILAGNNRVSVVLNWGQLDADVYAWQIDDDCGFVAPMVREGVTSEDLVTVTDLNPDVKYCWRVRALEPALSRWSDAQSFTTIAGTELVAPKLVSPKGGATILDTNPAFQWSAIGWADRYQLQVASDSGFGSSAIVVDEALGNTQGYQSPVDLANGTYYWRVKAMSDISQTSWSSTGIFTVASELPGTGTEPWVWGLIVLGVILLLLIIWLIVRTRTTA
jgi:hypothetical protein